jgi:hypothetical protein
MKFLKFISTLLLLCASCVPALANPTIGVVVESYGQADLTRAEGPTIDIETLVRIHDGDLIHVGVGSLVEVAHVTNGRRYEIIGPCTVRIKGLGAEVESGKANSVRAIASSSAAEHIAPEHLPQRGHMDHRIQLRMEETEDTVRFQWKAEMSGPYFLRVFSARDGKVEKVLWSTQTRESWVDYQGPELEKDRSYIWQVAAGDIVSSARFRVYSQGALDTYQRAESELGTWAQKHPDDPAVHVVMALIHDQHGEPDKAFKSMMEAKKRQTGEQQQKAVDYRMAGMAKETTKKARSQWRPMYYQPYLYSPHAISPGYWGGYGGWRGRSGWLW